MATANGDYAVIVTDGDCSDTSACLTINSVSLIEYGTLAGTSISPNPFDKYFTLMFDDKPTNAVIEIRDISSKLVYKAIATEKLEEISFEGEAGAYFITITNDGAQKTHKIIKN